MSKVNFGVCAICQQGQLVAVKNAENGELLVMCDDCESQWRSPADAQSYEKAMAEEVCIVEATEDDVKSVGWVR